jgi:hypothetical protein
VVEAADDPGGMYENEGNGEYERALVVVVLFDRALIGLEDARSREDPLAGVDRTLPMGVADAVVIVAFDIALMGRLWRSTELPRTLTGKFAVAVMLDMALNGLLLRSIVLPDLDVTAVAVASESPLATLTRDSDLPFALRPDWLTRLMTVDCGSGYGDAMRVPSSVSRM